LPSVARHHQHVKDRLGPAGPGGGLDVGDIRARAVGSGSEGWHRAIEIQARAGEGPGRRGAFAVTEVPSRGLTLTETVGGSYKVMHIYLL
jgi:hypothetical protein